MFPPQERDAWKRLVCAEGTAAPTLDKLPSGTISITILLSYGLDFEVLSSNFLERGQLLL